MKGFLVITIFFACLSGCAHVVSRDVLEEVNRDVSFAELRKDPGAYTGKVVLLAGVIVKTVNREDGTLLEIYQTEMESGGMPIHPDVSGGRFLALYEGFLDSEIYRGGRKVTIAGTVRGKQAKKLGQVDYHYPYLIIKEIHLWEEGQWHRYEPYPWGFWEPRWRYPWHPFYMPYRGYPHYPFY